MASRIHLAYRRRYRNRVVAWFRSRRWRLRGKEARSFLDQMFAETQIDDSVRYSQFSTLHIFCLNEEGKCFGGVYVRATYRSTGTRVLERLIDRAALAEPIDDADFEAMRQELKPWLRNRERIFIR